jgi:hypothetical protein
MIATSKRSGAIPAVSRQYEFSRLQDQTLASAYEAFIPVISRRQECLPRRRNDRQAFSGVHGFPRRSVAGA